MSRLIASLNALVVLLCALTGFSKPKVNGNFNNKSWMSAIDDGTCINAVSIPGTHDSCALYEPIESTAKCQDFSVSDQLDMGVRFLDLRCFTLDGRRAMMCHGVVLQAQYLDDIIDDCVRFLKENSTETIIVSIRDELRIFPSLFVKMLKSIIDENKDMWYTDNSLPTLGSVRGKMVLFNRFDEDSDLGIRAEPWMDNDDFASLGNNYIVCVQDNYNIGRDFDKKWEAIRRSFSYSMYNSLYRSNILYINFISSYIKEFIILPNPRESAKVLNARTAEYLDNIGKTCTGITVFDFVTEELCEKVIKTNIDI